MRTTVRYGVGTLGTALLIFAGGAVAAADDERGQDSVDVSVNIEKTREPGTLALTVAASATSLHENDSTDAVRQFTGTLPNVTVTDTRTASEIPDGADWYVLGTASDFTSGAGSIDAGHLGWSPTLVSGSPEGDGVVSVGGDVETVLDGDVGLKDLELLYLGDDLPAVEGGGSWTASADLFLRVPADVAPGDYRSVITLSLFE